MKKLFLILIVMVAFATTSSFAYTSPGKDKWYDNSRAWVAAWGGASNSLAVTLPSGYGWTNIQIVMIANRVGDYVSASSNGGSCNAYGPCPYKPANFPYYAGTRLTLYASSGSADGFAQISAYYQR